MKKLLFCLFFSISTFVVSADFSLGEELKRLEELRSTQIITEEEYLFFYSSLTQEFEEKGLYTISINKKIASNFYRIRDREGKIYFPSLSFFELLNHNPPEKNRESILFILENREDFVEIQFLEKTIRTRSAKIFSLEEESYFFEENELYLSTSIFEELFLSTLKIDRENFSIEATTNFATQEEQLFLLSLNEDKINREKGREEVVYTNPRKLFEPGYLRIISDLEKSGKDSEWNNKLEYQGALLLGNVTLGYNPGNKKWDDGSLRYTDIWNEHSLDLWRYQTREKGISFKKNKSYFWNGKKYIIREDVPIGSTVELLYMGSIIDVKRVENGEVYFDNDEIQEDRNYTLKIYTPEGDILLRTLHTSRNYNHQSSQEVEYDLLLKERKKEESYEGKFKFFYGLNNDFTMGVEYFHLPEYQNIELELVYENKIKNFPYVLEVGVGRALEASNEGESYRVLGEIDIKNWNLWVEMEKSGSYSTQNFEITYDPGNFYTLGYEYYNAENKFLLTLNRSYKNLLTTFNYNTSLLTRQNEGSLNFYYGGFENFSVILNNSWKNFFRAPEIKLSLNSKNYFGLVDYHLEFKYSERSSEVWTFKFEVTFDDWFKVATKTDRRGENSISFGLDKTVDLRDIRKPIENSDVSRVKAVAFLDKNGNGILDGEEKGIEDIQISLGSQKLSTDSNGVAYFYGVPNKVKYGISVESPHPTHTVGNIKYSILGKNSSTIEAFIPLKKYSDLSGTFDFSKNLKIEERELFFSNLILELLDKNKKLVETATLDENGEFIINALLEKEYTLVISYVGNFHSPFRIEKQLSLSNEHLFLFFDGTDIFFGEETE
jgi:hypothetical protein